MESNELVKELSYKTSRSGGAGGQNVNKVETKVQLLFNVDTSLKLSEEQKNRIHLKLANRINQEGILSLSSDASRSQLTNKEKVTQRFLELIDKALQPDKERKKSKVPDTVRLKRLKEKKIQSERKAERNINFDKED
jgi:ribosome-associated protein